MHLRVRIHHWVLWWVYVGVICGIVSLVNIVERDLSREEARLALFAGILFWLLGGLLCYAFDGILIEEPRHESPPPVAANDPEQREWHAASDFLLPGNRKSLLPPRVR
jgi:hypothetical protein